MATINSFEDLKVWQRSRELCRRIFEIISEGKFGKDFALIDQINRSSGSIMDNIAEGFGRKGTNEFINFLTYANASALECKSQLHRALDRNYLPSYIHEELINLVEEITKMIQAFISYLGRSNLRGTKFKVRE